MRPRVLFATKRRALVVAGMGATFVIALGGAFGFASFVTQTTTTQRISTGTYAWAIIGGGTPSSGPPALYPTLGPQVFTFFVQDSGTLHEQFLRADLSTAITSQVAACPGSDFVVTLDTHTATGSTLSPGAQVKVTVSVALDTALTTKSCQGSSPTLTLTIAGKD